MNHLFQRLTVAGRTLHGREITAWAEDLASAVDADWSRSLCGTVHELVTGDGSMTAHTSGTTGPSKRLRFAAPDLEASARLTGRVFGLRPGDTALLALPCHYIAGRMMLVRAFVLGLDLHVADPQNVPSGGPRIAFAPLVGNQLQHLLEHGPRTMEERFGRILLGGGPVHARLRDAIRGLSVPVHQGYGSTETLTHVALRHLNGPDEQEDYQALPGVSFGVDPEGRLIVHTPHLSTVEHHTNDLVELVDGARFRWLGRADHVILSRGRKLHPEDLEARSTLVLKVPHAFFGEPDELRGERVVLMVEHGAGTVDDAGMLELLGRVLQPHELPVRIVRGSLPRTGTGKLQRGRLRDQAGGLDAT